MPRRRLHGETQKERQKKVSRDLKLRGTVTRKAETRAPLPFEASPELDPQDVEFLEAMRDLQVRRLPGQGGAPVRREAFERVRFETDAENAALFEAHLRATGVVPLGEAPPPKTGAAPAEADTAPRAAPPDDSYGDEIPDAPWALPEGDEEPSPPPRQQARHKQTDAHSPTPGGGTQFVEDEDGAYLMEEALRSGVANLNDKFQGAPPAKGSRRNVERSTSVADPDDELDLHGKTQEEAIHMVQHFLQRAHHKRLRAVLIITGRGLNSGAQGPVLRNAVQSWLERNGGTMVRRFAWAPPRLGGDGAIWVELW
jgi:DNA-nicking Smr family endonuclease